MPEPIRPASTKTFGRDNWVLIPVVADINAITATEWNSASALDITRILYATTGKPTQATNRVQNERRYGDTKQYEQIGISNVTGGEMLYAFGAQTAPASDSKKLYEKLPEGATFVLANRRGIGRAVNAVAGQYYNAYPIEVGPSFPADAGETESAESAMSATYAVNGEPAINKVLV